jgi:hypothetical protein
MKKTAEYITGYVTDASHYNRAIEKAYYQYRDTDHARKTHLFQGRYENIYLSESLIPGLDYVFKTILKRAAIHLGKSENELKLGFWFNEMQPGDRTTLHSHDDYDELLSAVYYVKVPPDSGHIVFHENDHIKEILPEEGLFILFSPELKHEVTENRSNETRLSLGINIGPAEND